MKKNVIKSVIAKISVIISFFFFFCKNVMAIELVAPYP